MYRRDDEQLHCRCRYSRYYVLFIRQREVNSVCASVTAVYLPFLVFGRVLTRLD